MRSPSSSSRQSNHSSTSTYFKESKRRPKLEDHDDITTVASDIENSPGNSSSWFGCPMACNSLPLADEMGNRVNSMVPVSEFSTEFHLRHKWPFLTNYRLHETASGVDVKTPQELMALVVCRCVNARGDIAHGRRSTLGFTVEEFLDDERTTLQEMLNYIDFCSPKKLTGVNEIKHELLTRGPVISTSFHLSSQFLNMTDSRDSFLLSLENQTHIVLIVGWKLTAFGEVWLVSAFRNTTHYDDVHYDSMEEAEVQIAFGQFGIDKCCFTPTSSLENLTWEPGPYFDHDRIGSTKWREWHSVEVYLSSSGLERLASCFEPDGLFHAVKNKSVFILRDKLKKAHSRGCYLTEVTWMKKQKKWKIDADFV